MVPELLHIAMRLIFPEKTQFKFKYAEFNRFLLPNYGDLQKLMIDLNYGKITSSVFKDVLKKKALW